MDYSLFYEISIVIILSLIFGSFLNVLIVRIPKNEEIVFTSSHCRSCDKKLKWYHNIPLLSFIYLKGKCSYCNEPISLHYPLVEGLQVIISIFLYMKLGFGFELLYFSILFGFILSLSVIDYYYHAVPDSINLLSLLMAILITESIFDSFIDVLIIMGGLSLLRFSVSYIIKKEAMGEGDIVFGGVIGAILGLKLSLIAIYLSALVALPFAFVNRFRPNTLPELPYIPFLAISLFTVYMLDDIIMELLRGYYG